MASEQGQEAAPPRRKRPRGPWVHLACICDKVDSEGNVLTLHRIIDVLNVFVGVPGPDGELLPPPGGELPTTLPSADINFVLVVSLKSGDYVGEGTIRVELEWPNGRRFPGYRQKITLRGAGHGFNFTIAQSLRFGEPGTIWFNVYFGRRLLTKVPFTVYYAPAGAAALGDEAE